MRTLSILCLLVVSACPRSSRVELAAAASLQRPVEELVARWTERSGVPVHTTFAASGTIQRQIEHGAPVDLFLSAADQPVMALERKNLVAKDSRAIFAINALVLIVPAASTLDSLDALQIDHVRKIAMGEPRTVPVGMYAMEALKAHSLDEKLRPRFVFAKDARQVLSYVESGDVEAGFVYATDAKDNPNVRVVETLKTDAPIVYPLVVIQGSPRVPDAMKLREFLLSPEARDVLQRFGFIPP